MFINKIFNNWYDKYLIHLYEKEKYLLKNYFYLKIFKYLLQKINFIKK